MPKSWSLSLTSKKKKKIKKSTKKQKNAKFTKHLAIIYLFIDSLRQLLFLSISTILVSRFSALSTLFAPAVLWLTFLLCLLYPLHLHLLVVLIFGSFVMSALFASAMSMSEFFTPSVLFVVSMSTVSLSISFVLFTISIQSILFTLAVPVSEFSAIFIPFFYILTSEREKLIKLNRRKIKVTSEELVSIFIHQLFISQLFSCYLLFLSSHIVKKRLFDKAFDINNRLLVKDHTGNKMDLRFMVCHCLLAVKSNKVTAKAIEFQAYLYSWSYFNGYCNFLGP